MRWFTGRTGRIYNRKRLRLCFMALNNSCGTTHLAVACANYYASKERRSVLYIESAPFEGIMGMRTSDTLTRGMNTGFRRNDVDYMPVCESGEVILLLEEKYDVIIVECPALQGISNDIANRCDRKFFTFSAKPWHYNVMQMNMKQIIQLQGAAQGDFCSFALTEKEAGKVYEEFHLRGVSVPFIEDPCRLKIEDIRFLKRLLA